jgi:ribosomal protein S18 acetylase RimI-like enzyme
MEDEEFLFAVYAETRREEVEQFGWPNVQVQQFLRMQFELQQRSYRHRYPEAELSVVVFEGVRIGKLHTAVMANSIVLVDVALLPAYRNRGVGTSLIRDLQSRAANTGKSVVLHVIDNSPARRLYERMGFSVTGGTFPYIAMEWNHNETIGDED